MAFDVIITNIVVNATIVLSENEYKIGVMEMEHYVLQSMFIKKLKGLTNVRLSFSDSLTAVMGVNGVGKTTVIHALACVYQPTSNGKGENYKFPYFFIPNTDALWSGSEFTIINQYNLKDGRNERISRNYGKQVDRWSPRYENRPKRNVYYIGIDTCLPDIEKTNGSNRIQYSSIEKNDKTSEKVIEYASYILNKNYSMLIENEYRQKHFSGVKLSSGLKYSSLSMGTGEQRTIKILEKVLNAESYSLILIDELDLLLHISALKKMIDVIYEIAQKRHLQIVFTTHSLEINSMSDKVKIQYIDYEGYGKKRHNICYDKISTDLIYDLTGKNTLPIKIYVEDRVAKAIVSVVVKSNKMSSKVKIIEMGSINNAFTLAAGWVLSGSDFENTLIILDGDRYKTTDEKTNQIQKALSGNEENAEERREKALSIIREFNLPDEISPEEFLRKLYLEYGPKDTELFEALQSHNSVRDSHEWISLVSKHLNRDVTNIVEEIISTVINVPECQTYLSPIIEWLSLRMNI